VGLTGPNGCLTRSGIQNHMLKAESCISERIGLIGCCGPTFSCAHRLLHL
jgi:hypothetical protein